jgi:hypothetical protein
MKNSQTSDEKKTKEKTEKKTEKQLLQEWADKVAEKQEREKMKEEMSKTTPPEISLSFKPEEKKSTKEQILRGLSKYQPDKPK